MATKKEIEEASDKLLVGLLAEDLQSLNERLRAGGDKVLSTPPNLRTSIHAIGEELNKRGGMKAMQKGFEEAVKAAGRVPLASGRLEKEWHGIGQWLA